MNTVFVTGGHGFLGKHVMKRLLVSGYDACTYTSAECDLRQRRDIDAALDTLQPDTVIHLAARVGGIGLNQQQPARLIYENLVMGAEMVDAAHKFGIKKLVLVGSTCAYPKTPPVPFKEEDLWNGYPEETNAGYGIAKKVVMLQGQLYRQQYGLNAISLVPTNLYGEYDNFNPGSSHVIPAIILKCMDAKRKGLDHIEVWGTGSATRDFLYAGDCAEAIVLAAETYNEDQPLNIGSGREVAMRDLVEIIKEATGFEGRTVYDTAKPDGQPRRVLDVTKAKAALGFSASTSLEEGIRKAVAWYAKNSDSNL